MNTLGDQRDFKILDTQNMYSHIEHLPEQLMSAWKLGMQQSLPETRVVRSVVIAGMGGSAIGADLLLGYSAAIGPTPLTVIREYDLPSWVQGPETLFIASSHSGNTEETLSAWAEAKRRSCSMLAITTGGKLETEAHQAGAPCWHFDFSGQPRAAVGYSFGLLLCLFSRMGFLPEQSGAIVEAVQAMKEQQVILHIGVPVSRNPAKRLAEKMAGRFVVIMGSGVLAAVARRWKGQVSENAKAWAQFEFLPEADHNTLAGIQNPPYTLKQLFVIFLSGGCDHVRNRLRIELTSKELGLAGIMTAIHPAGGNSTLANLWTTLHFGDYASFYLAMAYGVDPTPITVMEKLKLSLARAG